MKLSLKRKEEEVEIEDENGTIKHYFLREMLGEQRDKFLNVVAGRFKYGEDGKAKGRDFTGQYSDLLGFCLYDSVTKTLVPPKVIQTWPASVQKALHRAAEKINGFNEDAEEAAKNESPANG